MIDFASALEEIVPNSMLFAAVPKPKIDFVWEIITYWAGETDVEVTNIESLMKFSKTRVEFVENLDILLKISVITASKAHEAVTS